MSNATPGTAGIAPSASGKSSANCAMVLLVAAAGSSLDQRVREGAGCYGPELRITGAAAQTRMVSVARIRLGSCESARAFKGIICDDVSEFESYMPSQPVWSLCPMSGSQKYWRDSRELRRRRGVSWTKFSGALGLVGEIRAPVSGREFSISVLRGQRLGSKWHESGSHRRLS